MRSDRGPEFKNALMKELATMLGSEWRFSAPLRPCEMGSNERVHQEVQKVLGAVVRQVGSLDSWSEWLVVAEYKSTTHKGSRIIVDEAMTTAARSSRRPGRLAGRQVAGYALTVASLLVCSFALWHLGRRTGRGYLSAAGR